MSGNNSSFGWFCLGKSSGDRNPTGHSIMPASPGGPICAMSLGGNDDRTHLLVRNKVSPTFPSVKSKALRVFIQTLHPLMQRPKQRAALYMRTCVTASLISITLIQLLQHKRTMLEKCSSGSVICWTTGKFGQSPEGAYPLGLTQISPCR